MLLAGDIGGTKAELTVFFPEAGPRTPLAQGRYPSAHYQSLEALVREFLATTSLPVSWACFAVAGPMIAGLLARAAVEEAAAFRLARYAGTGGTVLAMRSFGLSAPMKVVAAHFGFSAEHVFAAAREQAVKWGAARA